MAQAAAQVQAQPKAPAGVPPSSKVIIEGVLAADIDHVWAKVEPMLAAAIRDDGARMGTEDFRRWLDEGAMQLWIAFDSEHLYAAAVTEIIIFPRLKVCQIVLLAGWDYGTWEAAAFDMIKRWAKSKGCKRLEIRGRPGWKRRLASHGFRHRQTVLEMEL